MATTAEIQVPLESGDRLTRAEFHRRYCARPDIYKAELVDGVVYVTTRVTFSHGSATATACAWAGVYAADHAGIHVGVRSTTFMGETSEVQPDVVIFRNGTVSSVRVTADDFLEGAPDLLVEVASSSASYDLHDKKRVYERAGVREYIVWQLYERRIDWFRLRGDRYEPLAADADGMIESEVFPGLRLDVPAMLAGDRAAVLAALRPRRRRRSR
jgi:Uma2 family endonuclease